MTLLARKASKVSTHAGNYQKGRRKKSGEINQPQYFIVNVLVTDKCRKCRNISYTQTSPHFHPEKLDLHVAQV